jgi:hypothetical protein
MPTQLGYNALIYRFRLAVPALRRTFVLGDTSSEKVSQAADGTERVELRRGSVSAEATTVEQLTFALKREELNLCALGALFEREEAVADVQAWLAAKPSSAYARQAGFLVEWLTGKFLDYRLPAGARRVQLLDPEVFICGPAVSNPKYGVINNMLGPVAFCPFIRRTRKLEALLAENLKEKVALAMSRLEPELLRRAVDYLYLAETRSTYGIESEVPDNNRAAKFRHLLEAAGEPGALTESQLAQWQNLIVHPISAEGGFRVAQNWLSRPGRIRNIADYIPPPPDLVESMMDGVADIASYAQHLDPVLMATCAAFGLVFVHPFMDGNGRLHRFLIHHVLRQAGFTPEGVVLPISARMLNQLSRYSALLKSYSRPRTELLNYLMDAESGTILVKSPQPLWLYAYFDFTELCEFILECCKQSVEVDLAAEVRYLTAHDQAVRELETWLDLPQSRLNTLIDVLVQNHGRLAKGKRKMVELLSDAEVARIEEVVSRSFAEMLDAAPGEEPAGQ